MGQAKNNLRTKLMKINWITRNLKITIKIFQKTLIRMMPLTKA
jgi:hypothetical protein